MSPRPHVAVTLTQRCHRVPGGTLTSIERLVAAMAATNSFDITTVEALGDLRRPSGLSLSKPSKGSGTATRPAGPGSLVDSVRLGLPLPLLYDSWSRFGRPRISSAVTGADLIHLTVPITPPRDDLPLVATVHDIFPLTRPELFTSRGSRLMRLGLEEIRRRARRVMVPTEFVARECAERGFDEDRLVVVPWGADAVPAGGALPTGSVQGAADDATEQVLARYGIVGHFVLFVGTVEPRKNLGLLVEAMVRMGRSDVALVLAGPSGWGDGLGSAHGAVLGDVPGPVIRAGYVAEADLLVLERSAAAFCFPSLAEGFGLPVLEAMAAGAAVVTSSGTACAEVAADGALLVDPTSPDDLAAALTTVINDPAGATELRERGLRRAAEFTWGRSAELTLQVYEEALG